MLAASEWDQVQAKCRSNAKEAAIKVLSGLCQKCPARGTCSGPQLMKSGADIVDIEQACLYPSKLRNKLSAGFFEKH